MKFVSYNSTSNLSNYAIGAAYAFYVCSDNVNLLDKAGRRTVKRYSPAIAEIVQTNNECATVSGRWLGFTRVFGVVVDKHEATGSHDISRITVMFKTADGNYELNNYGVGIRDVFTNGKDYVLPAAVLSV